MNIVSTVRHFKNLSIRKIKGKVEEIKNQLPTEEQPIITYSKNFTISLSNYCQNQCGYCFYHYRVPKSNKEGNILLLGKEKIIDCIQNGLNYNCKEALIISGERPDSFQFVKEELKRRSFSSYIELVKDVCSYLINEKLLPHINIGLISYEEMNGLKSYSASMGLMLESTSPNLFKKGGVHEKSSGKVPSKRVEHIRNAGKLKIPFTTGLLLGIGESFKDRIHDLYLIKKIHEDYGHIQEIIIQNFVNKKGIAYQPKQPIPIKEILKIVGISKIILENDIKVQVPPNLIKGYEDQFIEMGIDDFGGISPFSIDYINPESLWPQIDELKIICEKKGYKLEERLPIYKKYIERSDFCPENIKKTIDNIILDVSY
jgi:FO synthase subunit 1